MTEEVQRVTVTAKKPATPTGQKQYLRKASLLLGAGKTALDLSELHFRFSTVNQDVESPNNCSIRVYNLKNDTVRKIRGEFDAVTVQAGYESNYGVIFQGNIKWFRIGRERNVDSYLDILAADGDMAYNQSLVNETLAAGWTHTQALERAVKSMNPQGVSMGFMDPQGLLGGTIPQPRGKVMFALGKVIMRHTTRTIGATWSIENGKVNVLPLDGYLPNEAVVLNSLTGLVGFPEQTNDGIHIRCLLNPRLTIGSLVRIDNKSINQLVQQNPNAAPIPYNQWTGLQFLASEDADGLYRVFVAEHRGDTRGLEFYTDLVCLAVNPVTKKVNNPIG